MTASGQPIQVMDPLFTIPSTLKRTFLTSTVSSSHKLRSETSAANGANHILDPNLLWIEKNIRPFLLEAYGRLIDAFQPYQGLFDHRGSGPSDHALHSQADLFELTSGTGIREPDHQSDDQKRNRHCED